MTKIAPRTDADARRCDHPCTRKRTTLRKRGDRNVRSSSLAGRRHRRDDGRARASRGARVGRRCARRDPPLRLRRHRSRRAARRLTRRPRGRARGGHGTVRVGQVDADAHPRGPRRPERRHRRDRRTGRDQDVRQRADEAPARPHRLRLPVLQPAPDADRRGEHHAPAADRREEGRRPVARDRAGPGGACRPPPAPPLRALARPAAARRDRARAALEADGPVRRRADRQPRLHDLVGDPRGAARGRRELRADDDHGHARRAGRRNRRPDPLPRRRCNRARAERRDAGRGAGCAPRGFCSLTSVALKGLASRKLRAALTALAIVLGVAMVSGSYVLTDSIQKAFHSLFASSYAGTDAVVSGKKLVDYSTSGNATVPAEVLAKIRRQPGVASAAGMILDLSGSNLNVKLFDKDGKIISGNGNPTFGFGIDPSAQQFNPMHLVAGEWARGDEVVVDKNTAAKYGFHVGDRVKATADAGTSTFRVSGIAKYGDVDTLGGATIAAFDLPTAQRLHHLEGKYTAIAVSAKDGVAPEALVHDLRPIVPSTTAVRTGEAQAQKDEKDIAFFVKYIRWFLLAFGFIALFVGGFVIFNTLSITVAQRTRELATLRTLGAFAIGALASAVGLVAGIGLAKLLSAIFGALDLALPEAGQPVEARTVVVSLLLGIVLTVISGLVPAVRATRVPPVAAVREVSPEAQHKLSKVAPIVAAVLGTTAAALLVYGFYGEGMPVGRRILALVLGALTMFVGLAAIFSRLVRPIVWVLGRPFGRVGRSAGELAAFNVRRNPGRTASTAAALMIGITLVAFVALFGKALQGADEHAIEDQVKADYVVTSQNGWDAVSIAAAGAARGVAGVDLISHVRGDRGRVARTNATVNGIDPKTIGAVFHFDWKHGAGSDAVVRALGPNEAVVKSGFASTHGLALGKPFAFTGPDGRVTRLVPRALFEESKFDSMLGSIVVSNATFDRALPRPHDQYAFVNVRGGPSDALTTRLEAAYDRTQAAQVKSRDDYVEFRAAGFTQILNLLYVLLALSVIVSLFGIVNTLALAVFERTREIGMLRAVGMTRRQARRMIRHESVMTSLLGAALGLPVGIGLAALATGSLRDYGVTLELPIVPLVGFTVLAIVVGVLAAILPARRAGKLNVLAALQYE